jgi:hypothetical protein
MILSSFLSGALIFWKRFFLIGFVCIFYGGCLEPIDQQPITFLLKDNLKNQSTIMIDIVCVFDPILAQEMEKMFPVGYFAHVDEFMLRYHKDIKIWRFVASQQKEVYELILQQFPDQEYFKFFFFCAYPVQGRFCGTITDFEHPVVLLSEDKIIIDNKNNVHIPNSRPIMLMPRKNSETLSFVYQLANDFSATEKITTRK